jgi:hypothetical protein
LPALEQRLAAAQQDLQHRKDKSEAEATAAAAKQAAAAEREEVSRPFSEAGVMMMVEARLKLQHRIDNSSDKTDQVWKRVVYAVSQAVSNGDLPSTDLRSEKATEKKYMTEYGEFKLWCARAQRAVSQSGVAAEDVEDKVREHYRPTTPLFLKFNMGMRPMAQPPLQMSGNSADIGGLPATDLSSGRTTTASPASAASAASAMPSPNDDTAYEDGGWDGEEFDDDELPTTHTPRDSSNTGIPAAPSAPPSGHASSTTPSSATATPSNRSSISPPLHIGGESSASSGRSGKRKVDELVKHIADEAAANRQFLVELAEKQEKVSSPPSPLTIRLTSHLTFPACRCGQKSASTSWRWRASSWAMEAAARCESVVRSQPQPIHHHPITSCHLMPPHLSCRVQG